MEPTRRRIVATITAALVLLAVPASAGTVTDDERADAGAGYLATQQRNNGSIPAFSPIGSTADAVLAFVASGAERAARADAVDYLRGQVRKGNVTRVGLVAKVVQAVVAVGRDPGSFGGENLVRWLRTRVREDGQLGNAVVFDDALGVLALQAAGVDVSRRVTGWLLRAQCPVGGWSYDTPYDGDVDDEACFDGSKDDFFTADTNTTAYAVMAIEHAGRGDDYRHSPFAFFAGARDATHDGWGYTPAFGTDANSTALVIQAYLAADRSIPSGGRAALRALQPDLGCGAWSFDYDGDAPTGPNVGATIGAIPAVVDVTFPLIVGGAGAPRSGPARGC